MIENQKNRFRELVLAVATSIIDHEPELTRLDQAIGDGDHGLNMKRGFEEVLSRLDDVAAKPLPDAMKGVGMALIMKVGGASGPLYGTLFVGLGKELPADGPIDGRMFADAFGTAIEAVKKRGKSDVGQKTMLDVLAPVHASLANEGWRDLAGLCRVAQDAAAATIPMRATRGRASYLGERSIGHLDPGARSTELMINAACEALAGR